MQLIKESIEKRESQLEILVQERDEFETRIEVSRSKIEKASKVVTVKPVRKYRATKGDSVDEMLANVLSIKNCEIPISRIGDGWYMFGSKKIYTKIMNNKLVCRVGGGYSNMDEFINTYAESERLKLERLDPAEIEALHANNGDKHMIKSVPLTGRGGGSPKVGGSMAGRSPRAGGGTSVYMGSPKLRKSGSGTTLKRP